MPADCPLCQKVSEARREDIVWEFSHSIAFLGPWQYYTGYCVVVSRRHATELSQLSTDERRGYLDEMCLVARTIEIAFEPAKLNYELLGNQVGHLHWHLFPRSNNDPDRLRPVWFALDGAEQNAEEKSRLEKGRMPREQIRQKLHETLKQLSH